MRTVIEFYQYDEETAYMPVVIENVDIMDIFAQLNNEFILVYPMVKVQVNLIELLGLSVYANKEELGERFESNDRAGLIIRPIDIKRIYNEI